MRHYYITNTMKVISNTNVNLVGNQNAIFSTPIRYGSILGVGVGKNKGPFFPDYEPLQ